MPIERLRMRPWLENALDEHKYPGVEWVNKELKTFRLPWKHASRNGWKIQTDASLFQAWAEHTGKYKSNEKPNPKTWKANFRCALNSLPDMEELIDRRSTKGNNAYKMYRIISNTGKKSCTKRFKGRCQRKKRSFSKARSVQKDSQTKKNDAKLDDTEEEQCYMSTSKPDGTAQYQCNVPQPPNGTHLVDHDYAVTRYFDLFNESADEDLPEVFDVPDSEMTIKTEPLSPAKAFGRDDEFSLYEECGVDTKNFKTSFDKRDERIMSDHEVIELLDEMSSDSGSTSDSAEAVMDEFLGECIMDSLETDFVAKSKPRANSAPGMLETPLITILCPSPSILPRSKSSTDIQTMISSTPQDLLQSCLA